MTIYIDRESQNIRLTKATQLGHASTVQILILYHQYIIWYINYALKRNERYHTIFVGNI